MYLYIYIFIRTIQNLCDFLWLVCDFLRANVGKYTSTMEHMGISISADVL